MNESEYKIFAGMEKVYAEESKTYGKNGCPRCGAKTQAEGEKLCAVSGEDDDCPGVYIWPD